nr:Peptidase C2 domain containing protein [Haemonchus contortus]
MLLIICWEHFDRLNVLIEIHNDPHLFVEGASPNDVTQGVLGNCWFVSACSALTHNQHLLNRVIPDAESQEWHSKKEYAGVFRFRFWRFGIWIEVVIDDLLPTRSKTSNEFWSALLEKAFAKSARKRSAIQTERVETGKVGLGGHSLSKPVKTGV